MRFITATAAKNKTNKFNKPIIVHDIKDLELFIRDACVKAKNSLTIKIPLKPTSKSIISLLKQKGYTISKTSQSQIWTVSW